MIAEIIYHRWLPHMQSPLSRSFKIFARSCENRTACLFNPIYYTIIGLSSYSSSGPGQHRSDETTTSSVTLRQPTRWRYWNTSQGKGLNERVHLLHWSSKYSNAAAADRKVSSLGDGNEHNFTSSPPHLPICILCYGLSRFPAWDYQPELPYFNRCPRDDFKLPTFVWFFHACSSYPVRSRRA